MEYQTALEKTTIDEFQRYLFHNGTYTRAYESFGAHICQDGVSFTLWAPSAKRVSVVGSFNDWEPGVNAMEEITGSGGVWNLFLPGIGPGELYKYCIETRDGELLYKADPYAFASELRPGTASVIAEIDGYQWKDGKYHPHSCLDRPALIYELHLGSWQTGEDGSFLGYGEIADRLCAYVKENHFTHVELMPIAEHPFDGSWGYQTTGYYAVTSRYGSPRDFKEFVDKLHRSNIGVIIDWVPAHFPRDAQGLRLFDGTPLYEYADPRLGEHKEWGTLVFDYGKGEVRSFLLSNALFWLREFHIDGLRVDAVSSMLYRDYGRQDGQWVANEQGGKENLEAVSFFQELNTAVFQEFPEAMMVAEESTAWPLVTKPADIGGLGFNYKWNMGWMNDVLSYFSTPPQNRKYVHNKLTFSMMYAFSENYILPFSHDEVVHGKCSLLSKMPGEYEEKFASLRAMFAYMMAHPGKKLLFMGGEFGQFIEWNYEKGLDWQLLDYPMHQKLAAYVRDLNKFYQEERSLWQIDDGWEGFRWIDADDGEHCVLSFLRLGKKKGNETLVLCNFSGERYDKFPVGVPRKAAYEEVFTSDASEYGGSGTKNKTVLSKNEALQGMPYSIAVTLPPFSVLFFKRKKGESTKESKKKPSRGRKGNDSK